MIIGISGENCAGKTTCAQYLIKKGFHCLSLSDILRELLKEENVPITRENLIKKGNEVRAKRGWGALADIALKKIPSHSNYVVDSIRNPAEVDRLRESGRFFLFYITADPKIRFERMRKRGREADPNSYELFLKFDRMEMEGKEGEQNLLAVKEKADVVIENNASLDEFYDAIDGALSKVSKEFRMRRPSWDEYFMQIAHVVAGRSNCIKRKVAAIIVKDRRIISTGYNGTPKGTKNCSEGGCPRCNSFSESGKDLEQCLCSHGEENAIVQAALHGIAIKGATLYTTFSPCLLCAKMIINSGIREVVYEGQYPLEEKARQLLEEAGVQIRKLERG